jgi:Ca2+/H+ antiporter, TMEM165/GDT1 family
MNYCGHQRGKSYWIKRAIFIPIAIAAGIFFFGIIVMLLWNNILATVLGVGIITFWQALGILVLSKILFGGFPGGHSHHKSYKYRMHEKMMNLSPEEREKMKAEFKERCGHPMKED